MSAPRTLTPASASVATQLRSVDSILLGVLAGVTLAFTLWVDVV